MADMLTGEQIRLNYQDYCALPDDGRRYEILDGELVVSPSPRTAHQVVIGNLFIMLSIHVRRARLGGVYIAPLDVLLGEHSIVQPDLIFISAANLSIVGKENIRGIPDLLVEVVSPTKLELDLRDKRQLYARLGVPWYWIIAPDRRELLELRLAGDAYAEVGRAEGTAAFEPNLFPGLRIDLAELWS